MMRGGGAIHWLAVFEQLRFVGITLACLQFLPIAYLGAIEKIKTNLAPSLFSVFKMMERKKKP